MSHRSTSLAEEERSRAWLGGSLLTGPLWPPLEEGSDCLSPQEPLVPPPCPAQTAFWVRGQLHSQEVGFLECSECGSSSLRWEFPREA